MSALKTIFVLSVLEQAVAAKTYPDFQNAIEAACKAWAALSKSCQCGHHEEYHANNSGWCVKCPGGCPAFLPLLPPP